MWSKLALLEAESGRNYHQYYHYYRYRAQLDILGLRRSMFLENKSNYDNR